MPKIHDVLRLHASELSARSIAQSLSISRGSISNILSRAEAAGVTWPLPEDCDEDKLESLLYPKSPGRPSKMVEPDWNYIFNESMKKEVTLYLLWTEFKSKEPNAYQYSQFCERYRQWRKAKQLSLRQIHRAGEKLFIDYAGPTIPVIDGTSGEIREAQLFVATLGASSYTYVEAQWGQDLQSFIQGHVRAFKFFGGVPELLVPDNLKSGVKRADRYEPTLNRTYYEMATHFDCAVMPTRPYKPKDKAKVESAVLVVERWILAVLRNRTFFSLFELNFAIKEELLKLNQKPFQKMEGSRQSMFETLDKPALRELPASPYEFANWHRARANIDYHITVDYVYYSLPYTLVKQEVDVRMTESIVEIFHKGKRVASHRRAHKKGTMVTDPAHRPKSHQKHMEWTPSRLISWGCSIGTHTGKLVEHILNSRPHPEQGYRSCLGIISLSKRYTREEVEAAAARAISFGAYSYQSVKSILRTGLGQLELHLDTPETPAPIHENVRGAAYYQEQGDKQLIH
jgi:transposase